VSAESFTVLAILEARDRASEIFAKVDESLDKFSETATKAGETAKVAGTSIDESLLKTASGADALDVASARVAGAQEKATRSAEAQAEAEKNLVEVHKASAAAADDDVAAQYRLMEADQKMTLAARENAKAQKELSSAQKLQADTAAAAAAKDNLAAAGQKKVSDSAKSSAIGLGTVGKVAGVTALAMGVAGALMVKAAGNFQDSTTHLVTDAGESAKNLGMVQAGILQVSTATGTSAASITDAMYHIESGGFHAASGLALLKTAAEGARVGGADLDTVSKTLVSTMNAYGLSSKNATVQQQMATGVMNQLIATVSRGDMRMQDLASSLSSVAPLAAAAHIQFSQVGGAIATMTAQGMTAQQATQDLSNTIRNLSNPNNVAIAEMNQLGISSNDVAQHLGQRGLTGTIGILTKAILDHMGKSGQVMMSAFTQSTTAGQDLQVMLQSMPAPFRAMAQGFAAGKVSAADWAKELKAQTPVNAHLMSQFATLYEKSHSFNSILAKGGPAAQTYTAALAKMMGGATGLNTALMLTGKNASVFAGNAAAIAAAAKKGGTEVDNWSTIQGTFNFKLASAKTAAENTGIAIGSALLPAATALLSAITSIVEPIAEWTAKHKTLTEVLFAGVAALAATVAILIGLKKAYDAVKTAVTVVTDTYKAVEKWATRAAATQEAAAGEAAVAQETAAEESATAQEGSALRSSAAWVASGARAVASAVASAATTAAAWAASAASGVASAAVWVAGAIAKVAIMVAANVAGAAVTMAAWIVANAAMLLGIGLLIAVVVAAVILIVKNWSKISAFAKKAFDDVVDAVKVAINWVKSHWPLLLAILTGPIGLAVYAIIKYWHDITAGIAAVVNWVKSHWPLLLAIITGPIGLATLFVVRHWDQIVGGARSMIGDVTGFFTSLPGRILHALGDLGNLLYGAGGRIVQGLINGVMSMVGALANTVSSVVNTIKSYLPFSPAKKGPLSGSGAPRNSGLSIGRQLAEGLAAGTSMVASASHRLAGAVSLGAGGGIGSVPALSAISAGRGAGGGGNIIIDVHDNTVMSDADINKLVAKVGTVVASKTLPQAGVRVRY
jgi:TP901 family phage tail tape measure protein